MRIKWNKVCKAPGTYQYPGNSNNIQPSLIHFINISRSFQKPGSPHPTLIPSDQPIISSHRTTATAFYLISLWHFYSILTPPPHSSQNDLSNLRNLIILLTRHPSVVSNCSQDKLYIPCQSPQGPASLFLAHAIPSAWNNLPSLPLSSTSGSHPSHLAFFSSGLNLNITSSRKLPIIPCFQMNLGDTAACSYSTLHIPRQLTCQAS